MPTAVEYSRNTNDCLAAADKAHDEVERGMLLLLVEKWRKLAEYKSKLEDRLKTNP